VALAGPLVVDGDADAVDVFQRADDVRAGVPVLEGVIDATIPVEPLGLNQFAPGLLPVRLGGTGRTRPPDNRLLVGDGINPLQLAPAEASATPDGTPVLRLGCGLRITSPDGDSSLIRSGADAVGRPALLLTKSDGDEVNLLSPIDSLHPQISGLDVTAQGEIVLSAISYRPATLALAVYPDVQRTAHEVLEGFGAASHKLVQLSGLPAASAAPPDTGFPSRTSIDLSLATTDVAALLSPGGWLGAVLTDDRGNVSPPGWTAI
jgi:hypothetical protein